MKTKIEIEVDIPDDMEVDRIDCATTGEPWVSFSGTRGNWMTQSNVIILREKWKPPAFLKKGWLAMDEDGTWCWYSAKPRCDGSIWTTSRCGMRMIAMSYFIWTPPTCTDWTQSLREIPGAENETT